MRTVGFKADPATLTQVDEVLNCYGFTGENRSDNLRALFAELHRRIITKTDDTPTLQLPDCKHLVLCDGKVICSFRRPCSPPNEKVLRGGLKTCFNCKKQEHNIPIEAPQELATPVKLGELPPVDDVTETTAFSEPAEIPEPQSYSWAPPTPEHLKKAFTYNRDGSKNCPFDYRPVWIQTDCPNCEPDKKRQCTELFYKLQRERFGVCSKP
jgi:hypothetical protein